MHFSVKISPISFHFTLKNHIFCLENMHRVITMSANLKQVWQLSFHALVQRYNCFIRPREFLQPYIMFQNGSDLKTPQYISRSLFHSQDIKIFLFQENIFITLHFHHRCQFPSSPNVLCRKFHLLSSRKSRQCSILTSYEFEPRLIISTVITLLPIPIPSAQSNNTTVLHPSQIRVFRIHVFPVKSILWEPLWQSFESSFGKMWKSPDL